MTIVIEQLLAGQGLGVVFREGESMVQGFIRGDQLDRLLVILHESFRDDGLRLRDVLEWKRDDELSGALWRHLRGQSTQADAREQLPTLIAARLGEAQAEDLTQMITEAVIQAVPLTVDSLPQTAQVLLARQDQLLARQDDAMVEAERRHAEVISKLESSQDTAARALVEGPLRQAGQEARARAANQHVAEGRHMPAAKLRVEIADTLAGEGLHAASETFRELAATAYVDAGMPEPAIELLERVANAQIARGSDTATIALRRLEPLYPPDERWRFEAIQARDQWPFAGGDALVALETATRRSEGTPEHVARLAEQVDLLALFGEHDAVLEATHDLPGDVTEGPRLHLELDRLTALSLTGEDEAAEAGWGALTEWADTRATANAAGLVWQRRGILYAYVGDVDAAHGAYRRAMAAWSREPNHQEQVADAFFSLQAASMLNGKIPSDLELRALAAELRGGTGTPAGRTSALTVRGMMSRLDEKPRDALRAYAFALAVAQRTGSLADVHQLSVRLGELYERLGHPRQALANYLTAGKADESARVATGIAADELTVALPLTVCRWERASAFRVIAREGARLPDAFVGEITPALLDEAREMPDGLQFPQPARGARRALAAVALQIPDDLRPKAVGQLCRQLGEGDIQVTAESARALSTLTDVGLCDETEKLVDVFLADTYNHGVDVEWLARHARDRPGLLQRIRASALGGDTPSLEVLVLAGAVEGDDELTEATNRVARGISDSTSVSDHEEQLDDGTVRRWTRVGMGVGLDGPAIAATAADEDARRAAIDGLLAVLGSSREPEGHRASAAQALFNLVPHLPNDRVQAVADALHDPAQGQYTSSSPLDTNIDDPLGAIRIALHVPHGLRAGALVATAQLVSMHSDVDPDGLRTAIELAFRDGQPLVLAAAYDALARLSSPPGEHVIEGGMKHPDAGVRAEALGCWGAHHDHLPRAEIVDDLMQDRSVKVRMRLMRMAEAAGDDAVLDQLSADPHAYVRKTVQAVKQQRGPDTAV